MLQLFFKLSNFVPLGIYQSVFNIDYNKLYEDGKRIILMDIDNTVVPYEEATLNEELHDLFRRIKEIGFEVIFISNNHKVRVGKLAREIDARYISDAWKPFKKAYRKALKLVHPHTKEKIVTIGDQLMTDVLGSNRLGIDALLVKPIKRKTEKWYTKLNRRVEQSILNRLKVKHNETYLKIEELYKDEK